jgi:hypothetical protein
VHAHPQVPIITWTTTCYVYISGIREGGIYSSAYAVQLAEQLVKQLVEEHGVHALEILVRMGAGWIVTLGTVKLRWCVCVCVCGIGAGEGAGTLWLQGGEPCDALCHPAVTGGWRSLVPATQR